MCDPRDAITAWQRRLVLPMILWMAAISRLFHSSVRAFPSSTRVVGRTGRREIATCSMFQTCSIGLWSGELAGLQLEVAYYSTNLARRGRALSSIRMNWDPIAQVYVYHLIPVAYASHHASHHDVQVCSSTSADTSPHHDGSSTIEVMFGDVGILKLLPTSSSHSSASIRKVKTVPWLIGEEYRIPIVISQVDVILCPVQTRLLVKSG